MRRGFSLAELILCLGLISLGLLALIGSMVYGMRANLDSTETYLADVAANSILSQARQSLANDFDQSVAARRRLVPSQPDLEYQVVEAIELGGALKRVEVTVYFRDRTGPKETKLWTKVINGAL